MTEKPQSEALDAFDRAVPEELNLLELADYLEALPARAGQVVTGRITGLLADHATVDLGQGAVGRLSLREAVGVQLGEAVTVYVDHASPAGIRLSRDKAQKLALLERLETAHKTKTPVAAQVLAVVSGGLSVDIGVKAFMPAREIDVRPVADPVALIGQRFDVQILRLDGPHGRVEVSRAVLLAEDRDKAKAELLATLAVGQVRRGRVRTLTSFGAFIDLGGLDGLLHIKDMSWGRIKHPSECVAEGDELDVQVLELDLNPATPEGATKAPGPKIALGRKQLKPEPWSEAATRFAPGTKHPGKVVSLADYGAFVELAPGVEGLVHVSELAWIQRPKHPADVLTAGERLEVVVVECDAERKRLKLSRRRALENPWDGLKAKYPLGTVIQGPVRNLTEFGAFIGIEEGIDGLVHITDLAWGAAPEHASEVLEKGAQVSAMVLEIDPERERITLGIKQLVEDTRPTRLAKYEVGQAVTGTVTRVKDFGAFVAVEPGLEGLLHASEWGEGPAPEKGATLSLRVNHLDKAELKLGLAFERPAEPAPEASEPPAEA